MLKTTIFLLLIIFSLIIFFYSIFRIVRVLKIGLPEKRNDKKIRRIFNTIYIGFLQSKIVRFKFSGVLHFIIFWGFLILLISVIEGFIEGFVDNFSFSFLGIYYSIITFLQDIFGIVVLISAFILLIRRYLFKPVRFQNDNRSKIDATVILIMIIFVIITMYGISVQKFLSSKSSGYRPFTAYISTYINYKNTGNTYEFFWWSHNILILFFLNYLPYSKHLHILASIPNIYLSNHKVENKNVIKPLNFDIDKNEYFGAKDVNDLTWKQILDSFTCTECGRCTISCPAYLTGKTLNPKKIITNIRTRAKEISGFENHFKKNLVYDYITNEELWDCTTCSACTEECPVMIEHINNIIDIRRYLVLSESKFPVELNAIFRNLENNFSPWAINPNERNKWIDDFITEVGNGNIVKLYESNSMEDCDILFWVGCIGAFDKKNKNVTKSFAKLLNLANIKFGVLGEKEKCNGDIARRLGNEYLAQELIHKNIETFKKYKIKKIVTICPHCYNVFKNEYSQFGIELEVYHHTQYIYNLLRRKVLDIFVNKDITVIYHDPCYLGRNNEIYKEPRYILKSFCNLKEMPRTKSRSFCCGAGGGKMFLEETKGKRISTERIEEVSKENIDFLISSCPFCLSMLNDGIKSSIINKEFQIKDISEFLLEHIKLN